MSEFANEVLARSLGELRGRRAKLEQFLAEAGELDIAIREMEKVCRKVGATAPAGPRAVDGPRTAAPRGGGPPKEGTNAHRALNCLRDHPRGLNTSVIGREANIASGSVSVVLSELADSGAIVKVGRGFWRIANAEAVAG
jgi:hypothetical protein